MAVDREVRNDLKAEADSYKIVEKLRKNYANCHYCATRSRRTPVPSSPPEKFVCSVSKFVEIFVGIVL
jgi:hypothetical protein